METHKFLNHNEMMLIYGGAPFERYWKNPEKIKDERFNKVYWWGEEAKVLLDIINKVEKGDLDCGRVVPDIFDARLKHVSNVGEGLLKIATDKKGKKTYLPKDGFLIDSSYIVAFDELLTAGDAFIASLKPKSSFGAADSYTRAGGSTEGGFFKLLPEA